METRILGAIAGTILALAGCTLTPSGQLGSLPPVPDANAARVIFVRPWLFQGAGNTYVVTIDGVDLYGLDVREHVTFVVPPGERLIGVRVWDRNVIFVPARIHQTVTLQAEPLRTYYFRISPDRIDRTPEAEGIELVKQTRDARESEVDEINQSGDPRRPR